MSFKLIGMDSIINAMKQNLGATHYIISMNKGDGRTALMENISEYYAPYGNRTPFVEYTPEADEYSVNEVFADIEFEQADKIDKFSGFVAFDMKHFEDSQNGTLIDKFLDKAEELAEHATLVFFISNPVMNKHKYLIEKIESRFYKIKRLRRDPYKNNEMVDIIREIVYSKHGIYLEKNKKTNLLIGKFIKNQKIDTPKKAKIYTEEMVNFFENETSNKKTKEVISNDGFEELRNR